MLAQKKCGNYHQSHGVTNINKQAIQSGDYGEFKMADVAFKMLNKSCMASFVCMHLFAHVLACLHYSMYVTENQT